MKNLLYFLFLFTCLHSSGQTFVDQVDPFTNEKVKLATVILLPLLPAQSPQVMFCEKDNKKYIALFWPQMSIQVGGDNQVQAKKTSILLKMEDATILKFKGDSTFSFAGNMNAFSSMAYTASIITDEQLQYLMTNKIAILRWAVNGDVGPDLPGITDKNRKRIQKSAAYMLGMKELPDEQN